MFFLPCPSPVLRKERAMRAGMKPPPPMAGWAGHDRRGGAGAGGEARLSERDGDSS